VRFLDLTLDGIADNLALDEALLLAAEAGGGSEILRVWEWPTPAVVLGTGCRLTQDVDEGACRAAGVPILRRSSGGGTVLLGRGCLCYSLILSYDRSLALTEIPTSYVHILENVLRALNGIVPGLERAGTSDLAAAGRKFSGNSQQRKRTHLLHHGTLLYDFDVGLVGRYLRQPERQPEYRTRRDHGDFLMNLQVGVEELKRRLRIGWEAGEEASVWPEELVRRLVAEKYSKADWTRRR